MKIKDLQRVREKKLKIWEYSLHLNKKASIFAAL